MIKIPDAINIFLVGDFLNFFGFNITLCFKKDLVENPDYTLIAFERSADENFFSSATEATNPGDTLIYRQSHIFFIFY